MGVKLSRATLAEAQTLDVFQNLQEHWLTSEVKHEQKQKVLRKYLTHMREEVWSFEPLRQQVLQHADLATLEEVLTDVPPERHGRVVPYLIEWMVKYAAKTFEDMGMVQRFLGWAHFTQAPLDAMLTMAMTYEPLLQPEHALQLWSAVWPMVDDASDLLWKVADDLLASIKRDQANNSKYSKYSKYSMYSKDNSNSHKVANKYLQYMTLLWICTQQRTHSVCNLTPARFKVFVDSIPHMVGKLQINQAYLDTFGYQLVHLYAVGVENVLFPSAAHRDALLSLCVASSWPLPAASWAKVPPHARSLREIARGMQRNPYFAEPFQSKMKRTDEYDWLSLVEDLEALPAFVTSIIAWEASSLLDIFNFLTRCGTVRIHDDADGITKSIAEYVLSRLSPSRAARLKKVYAEFTCPDAHRTYEAFLSDVVAVVLAEDSSVNEHNTSPKYGIVAASGAEPVPLTAPASVVSLDSVEDLLDKYVTGVSEAAQEAVSPPPLSPTVAAALERLSQTSMEDAASAEDNVPSAPSAPSAPNARHHDVYAALNEGLEPTQPSSSSDTVTPASPVATQEDELASPTLPLSALDDDAMDNDVADAADNNAADDVEVDGSQASPETSPDNTSAEFGMPAVPTHVPTMSSAAAASAAPRQTGRVLVAAN